MTSIRLTILTLFLSLGLYSQEDKIYSLLNQFLRADKIDTTVVDKLQADTCFGLHHYKFKSKRDSSISEIFNFRLKQITKKETADTINMVFSLSTIMSQFNYMPDFLFDFSSAKEKEAKKKFAALDKLISKTAVKRWYGSSTTNIEEEITFKKNKYEIKYLLPRTNFPTPETVILELRTFTDDKSGTVLTISVLFLD